MPPWALALVLLATASAAAAGTETRGDEKKSRLALAASPRSVRSTRLRVARGGSVDLSATLADLLLLVVSEESNDDNGSVGGAMEQPTLSALHRLRNVPGPCTARAVRGGSFLQAGNVVPEMFGCGGPGGGGSREAYYLHSGTPLLDNDTIKLSLFRSVGNRTIVDVAVIHVSVVEQTAPLIKLGDTDITVSEFMGRTQPFAAGNVRFAVDPYAGNCFVKYSLAAAGGWPLAGQPLVLRHGRGGGGGESNEYEAAVDGFELPCHQLVDNESLVYEHLSPPSPDVDYVPLEVQAIVAPASVSRSRPGGARANKRPQQQTLSVRARTGSSSDAVVTQRFYLPVHVKGGLPNQPPKAAFVGAYVMDVDEFTLTTVISGVLSATDAETHAGQLVFNISKPPEAGHFVHLSDHTEPITSFMQEEMNDGMIAYWPPERSYRKKIIYEVEFRVHDSHFAWSSPIVLHIAVRPSASHGPRVAVNVAMSVLEGTTATINRLHLRVVGIGNPATTRIHVAGGLRHGRLELDGGKLAQWFTQEDIDVGRVRYVHDDSNSERDHIDLRIVEGNKESVRTRFFINVIPQDDTAPAIVRNLEARLLEGETIRISSHLLLATDEDSDTDQIRYIITRPPLGGELLRRVNPREGGLAVKSFTNRDVMRGYIYYKHLGGELHEDSFEFTLSDEASTDAQNQSPGHVFRLQITPVDDTPPEPAPDANRSASVSETDVLVLSHSVLHYTDRDETSDDDIVYNVTAAPQFVDGGSESDAGKIVSLQGVRNFTKDSALQPIHAFTQRDIKYGFVAYMPPATDIGLSPRLVRFWVVASDKSQNVAVPAEISITVMPIDNQPPVVTVSRTLTVREDDSVTLSTAVFSITDEDSPLKQLKVTLIKAPRFGYLSSAGKKTLHEGDRFAVEDILSGNVRYSHAGDEFAASDQFELSVSDGSQASIVACYVSIQLADDERPSFVADLTTELDVLEGSFVVLSSKNIAATDKDTDDATLVFQVQSPGQHGSLYLDNQTLVSRFTQQDVQSRRISYGALKEIGRHSVRDTIVFMLEEVSSHSPQHAWLSQPSPDNHSSGRTTRLTFRVQPVDNQSPVMPKSSVSISVKEGGEVRMTTDLFSANDPDTDSQALTFVLLQQPRWGFFENGGLGPGSEISMKGRPQASFSWSHMEAGLIRYVQSIHAGVEPKDDSALLYVTDGANNSSSVSVQLHIIGINDEAPTIQARNLTVFEGKEVSIENVTVADLDVPSDPLRLSITHLPKYGQLSLTLSAADGRGRQTTHQLPVKSYFDPADLGGAIKLNYRHDGSERFSDHITLQAFDGIHRTEVRVEIGIRPQNDAPPVVVRNAGALLYYNETIVLSKLMLHAHDEDSSDSDIVYILSRLPNRGYLEVNQHDDKDGDRVRSPSWRRQVIGDKFSQDDINRGKVRYTNHRVSTADKTADAFEFRISDGTTTREKETFEIEVRKSKALPDIRVTSESHLSVSYGAGAPLTTREVNAHDASDLHASLVYTLSRVPLRGSLERIEGARQVIIAPAERQNTSQGVNVSFSFSHIDLASGKIWYFHCGCDNAATDSVELSVHSVSSGKPERRTAFTLHVKILPASVGLPTVEVNESALVRPGGLLNLADVLHVSASSTSPERSNITIAVVTPLRYGKVIVNGRSMSFFSLDDLKSRRVTYMRTARQLEGEKLVLRLSSDSSDVHVFKGRIAYHTTVTIGVERADWSHVKSSCSDIGLNLPQVLETVAAGRQGFAITSNSIRLPKHCDIRAASLIIHAAPQFGTLMKADKSALGLGSKLTHGDLSRGILYVLSNSTGSNWNDSLLFSLSMEGQQQGGMHRLPLAWSVFNFATTTATVCENDGQLLVRIQRTGFLSGVAFVSIISSELTAKVGEDFALDRFRQLQFEPDNSELTFKITLNIDNATESMESFKLSLTSPVNAVLGNVAHMTVFIEDHLSNQCVTGRSRRRETPKLLS